MEASIGEFLLVDMYTGLAILIFWILFVFIMWWIDKQTPIEDDPMSEAECNCHSVGHPCAEHIEKVRKELINAQNKGD